MFPVCGLWGDTVGIVKVFVLTIPYSIPCGNQCGFPLYAWDNLCCMHYAHNDYPGKVRVMLRTIVEGEKPY